MSAASTIERLQEFDLEMPNHAPAVLGVTHGALVVAAARDAIGRLRGPDAAASIPESDFFTFRAEISNQNLDSHFTRMASDSLKNYAEDATTGVAFMAAHRHNTLPIGYSTRGEMTPDLNDGVGPAVMADFYTVKGLSIDGFSTDGFIKAVETGLIRDVSIGFKYGPNFMYLCSVCNQDFFGGDCYHIPGVTYSVGSDPGTDPTQQEMRDVLCYAWVQDARLSEVSAVFDGSTPNAMLTKAMREQRAGRLSPDVERMLKATYRLELPPIRKAPVPAPAVSNNNDKEREVMPNGDPKSSGAPDTSEAANALATERANLFNAQVRLEARACGVKVEEGDDADAVVRKMRAEIERLTPFESQAGDAAALRASLVDEAVAEGVRALGNDFKEEDMRKTLTAMPVDTVRQMRGAWKATADKNLPNERQTQEEGDPQERETSVDDDAEDFSSAHGAGI